MIIIGIDPGTRVTGYGIIQVNGSKYKLLDYGCIRPPQSATLHDRYLIIQESAEKLIEKFTPDVLAIETQFVYKNAQSALKLGMARGVVIVAARKRAIEVVEITPKSAKLAITGRGTASKQQVQAMVKQLLSLKELPTPEDAADALALAICHGQRHQTLINLRE